jgi:16S rRNA processing protein RimM
MLHGLPETEIRGERQRAHELGETDSVSVAAAHSRSLGTPSYDVGVDGSTEERVVVGRVGKSHGLDGSFVVEDASESPERFRVGAELYAGGEPAKVVGSKQARGRPVIRLDRRVERGATLEVPRDALEEPAEGEFYVFQLVGLRVEEQGGRILGTVTNVAPGVANDVLELDTALALPMVEDCVLEVDLEDGRIVVAPGFGG